MTGKNKAAQELGRLGGLVISEAKAKASRENGKLGGRPKGNSHQRRIDKRKALKLSVIMNGGTQE